MIKSTIVCLMISILLWTGCKKNNFEDIDYRHMYDRQGTVEKMLTDLNSRVSTKGMPTVSDIWDLNEQCYSLHIFRSVRGPRIFAAR